MAEGHLPVNEQSKALLEGEFFDIRGLQLLLQGGGHAFEAQGLQFVNGGVV